MLALASTAKPPRSAMINYADKQAGLAASRMSGNDKLVTGNPSEATIVVSRPRLARPVVTATTSSPGTDHEVQISSQDIETGLKMLLDKVQQVYGGRGKVKRQKKFCSTQNKCSVKFVGPERAARVLDAALQSIEDLQKKETVWTFSQKIEVSVI